MLRSKCNFYNNPGGWSSKLGNWNIKFFFQFLKGSAGPHSHLVHFWISGQSSASIYHRLWEHKFWQCQRFPEGLLSSSQGRHQYGGGLPEQVWARPHVWWPPQEGENASLIFLCKYLLLFNQSFRMIIFSHRDWWIRPYLIIRNHRIQFEFKFP